MTAYVLMRKQYWKYGTGTEPNVALVGSPTISNAVASGFTSNSYLKIGNFNPQNNPWEAVFKFTVANVTAYQYLIGVVASGFAININGWNFTNSKLRMSLSSTSSSYDMGEIVGVTTLVNGNTYWVKLLFTGSQYQLLLSDNAAFENATVECSVDSTKVISPWNDTLLGGVLENGVNSRPWQGSIDLTQSYIKINNKIWWYGTKAVKSTKDNYDFTTGKTYVLKRKRPTEYRKKVIDTATAGTYTFDVAKDTTARIILVGGGGAGGQVWEGHSEGGAGGSGACVYIKARLTAGTYTITNGAAASSLSGNGGSSTLSIDGVTLITAGGGYGGQGGNGVPGTGGTYTISDSLEIEKEYIVSNGNTGGYGGNMVSGAGGASLYGGYGKGGNSRGLGTSGYIFVELTTDETDYDYKIDNDACYVLKRKQYWKWEGSESTELAYACYKQHLSGIGDFYHYVKYPIETDYVGYGSGASEYKQVTSVSDLVKTGSVFGSVTEDYLTINTLQYPRYTAGDLYETVSTKVAVPATKDDYDFITD